MANREPGTVARQQEAESIPCALEEVRSLAEDGQGGVDSGGISLIKFVSRSIGGTGRRQHV